MSSVPAHSLPKGWNRRRMRFDVRANPVKSELDLPEDTEVSFVPMDAVGELGGLRLDQTRELADVYNGYTYFADGDVCIAKITPCFENGKGAMAEGLTNGVAFGTTELHVLRPSTRLDQRFLFYLTIAHDFRSHGESEMLGAGGQKRVPEDFLKDWTPPLPRIDIQRRIARFLDEKTACIDALIEKKQALLERLAEKRLTLTTRAVTRGLDPGAPMKDSGVIWMGEIPAHWDVLAIKRLVETPVTDGPHETPEFLDDGVPFVSAEAIFQNEIDFSRIRGYISFQDDERYSAKYKPRLHDVYLVKSGATTGKTAIVETDRDFNIWSPLAAIRCNAKCEPYFMLNFLRSRSFQDAVALSWSYGTQQNIGMGVIENLPVAVPPISEQQRIVDYIRREASHLDISCQSVERSISGLSEYRVALTTAAVTGQLPELNG